MSKYTCFDLSVTNHIAQVTLSRGDELNTMNRSFWKELSHIMDEINRNSEVRVVIMSSTGKHFCAGMDLDAFSHGVDNIPNDKKPDAARVGKLFIGQQRTPRIYKFYGKIRVPVIVAIQGGCIGGAVDMVTACDIRLATAKAFFCIQEINIGMAADVGTLQRLPRLIPDSKMRELAYTGRRMYADEAKSSGLVSETYDSQEDMLAAAKELAEQIASKSPIAIHGLKAVMNYSRDHTIEDSLEYNALWSGAMLSQEDMTEAISAFLEKREATFKKLADVKDFDETGS